MTYDEALAQWKQQNPPPITVHENGEDRVLTEEEYEAMAADRAQMLMDEANRQEVEEANKAEGEAIHQEAIWLEETAENLRDTSLTMTMQQLRNVVAHGFDILAHVIRYLHKQRTPPEPQTTPEEP
jgi:hypothetical protein